ncbi:ArsA family ATPase [Natribacillus halophilus]|uniref:Arsenite efflux ATP-binding protein ArsA n=1 Tax=Natribacillus halophilus TaxID=549003 RepID=A0A1G8R1T1_9BACI|nr:ArsA family ATPase [Natribacillus halophilus]SDJ10944.1 arsenite efflux ATP-binding protein ArsA [Natribacillus halophilus]
MRDHSVVFFGGKGGVGKSTCSAAFALSAAQNGKKVLLVSTDPAHNLEDLFAVKIGNDITKLQTNVYGLEIDAEEESKRYIAGVKENLQGLVHAHRVSEVHRQIDMAANTPGADESALFDALVNVVLEQTEHFDLIVFDTAPTGHTLRLLSLPEMMEAWIDGMLKRRRTVNENYSQLLNDGEPVEDPIYQTLMQRKQKFVDAREWLLDRKKTGFVYVLTPERLPIEETSRAVEQLAEAKMKVETLIVNKCLPEEAEDSSFFRKRREQEQQYIHMIHDQFKKQKKVFLPLLAEDISTEANLREVSEHLYSL